METPEIFTKTTPIVWDHIKAKVNKEIYIITN